MVHLAMSAFKCTATHTHLPSFAQVSVQFHGQVSKVFLYKNVVVTFVQACGGNMAWHNKHAIAYIWAIY